MTVLILLGIAVFGVGLASWVLGILYRYGMPWQIQSMVAGLILLLLAAMVAKLFSRN